jgi:hypothetical protein
MNGMKSRKLAIKTIEGFGDHWVRFEQTGISEDSIRIFNSYFSVADKLWIVGHGRKA